jgi:NADH dehydrogenase
MAGQEIHAVTGAFGYSGKYIAQRLLTEGHRVITLTNSFHRQNPFREKIKAFPFNFDNPGELIESLKGVSVLYNTYWVRFNSKQFTLAEALKNTLTMFRCAKEAGVERIVHVSILNSEAKPELEYFRCKAELEKRLKASGISYAILRPAVLFGKEDILINNIAWILRRFPFFILFGQGDYGIQPIYVDDLAEIAVRQGALRENSIINAIGTESFTYRELVEKIGEIIGKQRKIIHVSPEVGYFMAYIIGKLVDDIIVTRDEIAGLMAGMLAVNAPPAGQTRLTDWLGQHAETVGKRYTSEMARRKDRLSSYRSN